MLRMAKYAKVTLKEVRIYNHRFHFQPGHPKKRKYCVKPDNYKLKSCQITRPGGNGCMRKECNLICFAKKNCEKNMIIVKVFKSMGAPGV